MNAATRPVDPRGAQALLVSMVVPVYRTGLGYLGELLESVRGQSDPGWELVLVDDGSGDPGLTRVLAEAAASDDRIVHDALDRNSGVVAASNRGLCLAHGEFVALLDHDDLVAADAVARCREALRSDPDTDVLYSDETIIGPSGEVLGEFRKPAFSPERLRGQMYTGHLGVYRRSLLESIGGFRQGFDGSQDYDLILRATEQARAVRHIPRSLYRWRTLPTSVSHAAGNDHVFDAARRALTEHLSRTGVAATVTQTDPTGRYRIDRQVPSDLHVTVIVPTVGGRGFVDGADRVALPHTLRRLLRGGDAVTGDRPLDVLVLDGGMPPALRGEVADLLNGLGRIVPVQGSPWAVGALNRAALSADAPLLLLLGDDVVPARGDSDPAGNGSGSGWLDTLLGLAIDPTAALVVPRLLRWDGRVAAAGLALSGGVAHAIGAGCEPDDPGPFGSLQIDREVTAVPADCVLVPRELLIAAGGLSGQFSAVAAVADLSLKAAVLGRRTVVSSAASAWVGRGPRSPSRGDVAELARRWGSQLAFDAYWRDIG